MNTEKLSEFYNKYPKLNFIDKPSHLFCGVCGEIFKNPHQTICGCRFCLKCLKNILLNGPIKCPTNSDDCENLTKSKIMFDSAVNKEVMQLKICCPHESCEIIKTLKEIIDHVDECEYRMVKCSMCNDDHEFKNIKKHEDNECEYRKFECTYCSKTMKYLYYKTEHFNPDCDDLCEKYYVKECPNKCSTKGFINNLREHLKICTKAKHKCPLSISNCSNCKFDDEELKIHFDENLNQHNQYLLSLVKESILKIKNYESLLQKISSENSKLQEKVLELQNSMVSHSQLESEIKRVNGNSLGSSLNSLNFHQNGSFIWKITNLKQKKIDAESGGPVSFTSDSFYTSEYGYKMCLKIYPAGDGIGRGTHLSVFFAIMNSEYNDVLSWPFKHKVTLSLLDQEGNEKHHCEVFRPDEKSICYEKPKENINVASGAPKFYEWDKLIQSKYYKNDTIYLKISIIT